MNPSAPTPPRRSIQTRVMLLVTLGIVAAMVAPGYLAWSALDALTAQALASAEHDATLAAHHLENVLGREWNKLQEIAGAPAQASVEAAGQVGPSAEILRRAYFRAELMERTFVTDRDGRLTYQEPASSDGVGDVLPGAVDVMRTGRPGVSPVPPGTSSPFVHLLVPMRDWHGHIVGVAGGSVRRTGTRLATILREHANSPSRRIEVLDERGTIVAALDAALVGTPTPHGTLAADGLRGARPVSGTCRTCHGSTGAPGSLMAIVPLRQVRWVVSLTAIDDPVQTRAAVLRRTLLWLAPALLAFGLLFAYGAAESLLRPVRVLIRETERIAAGSLDQPVPPLGRDELGRLGHSFDHMRAALKASIEDVERVNATLERRVDERTRELQALSRQLAEREEARARLLRQVITAQEDERKRLARELHDETCQTISALAMRLETGTRRLPDGAVPSELTEAQGLAVRALDELHRLIYDLRPSVLDDLGLWSAIRWYAERQLVPRHVSVRCEFPDLELRLPSLYETALFRVSQEAISNIARHADADLVLIQGSISDGVLTLEIEDDGKGFDPAVARRPDPDGRGWGLLGITERIDALGGRVHIDAAPGQGVRLMVTVPLPAENPRV